MLTKCQGLAFSEVTCGVSAAKRIKWRDTTQICCGCRKHQAPLASPKNFEDPQNHSSPSKIKAIFVCLAMSALTTMLYEFVGGDLDRPQPYPMLRTWSGCSWSTPSHPAEASSCSPGWLQGMNQNDGRWGQQGGPLHRHVLIPTKTPIEMSPKGQVAIPHPQPKLGSLEILIYKTSPSHLFWGNI